MTNEQYVRSRLLGAIQLAGLLSQPHRVLTVEPTHEQPEPFSLSELDRLQQRPSIFENDQPSIRDAGRRAGMSTHLVEEALTRASLDTQWQFLRADVLSRLETAYVFRDKRRVVAFLEKNSFLVPLLLQISSKLRDYFGALSMIALEVSIDPENGKYEELWARIQTNLEASKAVRLLTRFDEEWWLDASVTSQNLMNVNLEFV